jgi:hypothetical protein
MSRYGAGLIGSVFGYAGNAFIKILLRQHEQNVTPLSQEGEYKASDLHHTDFSFSIFFL